MLKTFTAASFGLTCLAMMPQVERYFTARQSGTHQVGWFQLFSALAPGMLAQ